MMMNHQDLLKALGGYGYPLFGLQIKTDPIIILSEMVKSKDPRLLEGFPVVLAHIVSNPDFTFNFIQVEDKLKNVSDKKLLRDLYQLSCELFFHFKLEFPAYQYKNMAHNREYADRLIKDEPLLLKNITLDSKRLKETFNRYVIQRKENLSQSIEESSKLKEELRREYLFSLLLTPRQKELVNKRLRDQPFTKTEREYFSRVVKKKLQALADPDLHTLAQKALNI